MRAVICGGRYFIVRPWTFKRLDLVHARCPIDHVIEGGAFGGDRLGRYWAQERGIPFTTVRAEWDKYGKRAGYLRNRRMAEEFAPDVVIALPGGVGTQMMIDIARELGIPRVILANVGKLEAA